MAAGVTSFGQVDKKDDTQKLVTAQGKKSKDDQLPKSGKLLSLISSFLNRDRIFR